MPFFQCQHYTGVLPQLNCITQIKNSIHHLNRESRGIRRRKVQQNTQGRKWQRKTRSKEKQVSKINSIGTCWIWDVCAPSKLKHPVSTWIIRLWNSRAACAEYRFRSHRCRSGAWSPKCGRDSPRNEYRVSKTQNLNRTLMIFFSKQRK